MYEIGEIKKDTLENLYDIASEEYSFRSVSDFLVNIIVGGLLLTGLVYAFMMGLTFGQDKTLNFLEVFGMAFIFSLLVYLISMLVILSPIGEYFIRKKYKCKKIERTDALKRKELLEIMNSAGFSENDQFIVSNAIDKVKEGTSHTEEEGVCRL